MAVAVRRRWQRYWFAEGGRLALAIVRVAVAASVLLALAHLADRRSPVAANTYRPVGLWMLLGDTAPPDALVRTLWLVAWASTGAMLVGLASRTTTALSFVSACALAALSFSASRTWSHQYNVVFLAQLALLGAHSGDTLSLDWLIRTRIRKLPPRDEPRAYQWSLRLVQLAVVLMFAGAAFHKFAHGHFTLRWALSDNLRHHLLVRFDLAGLDRTAIVDWVLAESWRYRTAALLNMVAQAVPLVAVFTMRRPLLRLLAGLMFVVETLLLGAVVDLWNLHWLPLIAVFVDWEWLLRRRHPRDAAAAPPPDTWRAPLATRVFIISFVIYNLLTAFIPTLDQRLNTFPFSSFPMFATVRAREPYDEHLPYSVVAGTYELHSTHPPDARAQRWMDHTHRTVINVRDPDELERRLRNVLERMQYFYYGYEPTGIRLWMTLYEAPAHPAPARFEKHPIALLGELTPDGTFRTLLGTASLGGPRPSLEVAPRNVELAADARLYYLRDDRPELIPLAAPLAGNRFDLTGLALPGNPRHFIVETAGTRWLVATHKTWTWR